MFTVTKLSKKIARAFQWDEAAADLIHRRLRYLITNAIIPTTVDEDDERGTKLIGLEASYVAIVLLSPAAMFVDTRGLRKLASKLLALHEDSGKSGIQVCIEAARNKRPAFLKMRLRSGDFEPVVWLETEKKANPILEAYALSLPETLAELIVPVTEHLRPFLSSDTE
ncbi:hypothetical protein AX761_22200 [Rhizobium sp. 58]|nr:hypothetical protein AX761_22200 [Rhizobium sp. 58]